MKIIFFKKNIVLSNIVIIFDYTYLVIVLTEIIILDELVVYIYDTLIMSFIISFIMVLKLMNMRSDKCYIGT